MTQVTELFKPLSDDFFVFLKGALTTPFLCSTCVNPLCSCSGAESADLVFLPGERSWMERNNMKFTKGDRVVMPVCGDCALLYPDYSCSAKFGKPWDCTSFPLQPKLVDGILIPKFAKNCTVHPADVPDQWLKEVWKGWLAIERAVDPHWLQYYSEIPPHKHKVI